MTTITIKRVDEEHHRSLEREENKIVNSPEEITIRKHDESTQIQSIRRIN